MLSFQFKTELDPISLYAAIVSTSTAIFAVVQWWKTGPRIEGHVAGDVLIIPDDDDDANRYLSCTIYNRGSRRTTVSMVKVTSYRNKWTKLLRRPLLTGIIPNPRWATLPKVLEPGDYIIVGTLQDEQIISRSRNELFYMSVHYSDATKPILLRVKPIN